MIKLNLQKRIVINKHTRNVLICVNELCREYQRCTGRTVMVGAVERILETMYNLSY